MQSTKAASTKKKTTKQGLANLDIVTLILEDHKSLKRLIKVLKDTDKELEERQVAFEDLAPLLVSHAKPEEQTLYVFMKGVVELREEGFEGDVEHGLADQLLEEIKRETDSDVWSAKVKVLAELVEHHIEEEEEDMLPDFKKNSELEQRAKLGDAFMQLKTALLENGGQDTIDESVRH